MHRRDHAPGSTSSLRAANQRRVLGVLRSTAGHGDARSPTTQATLARQTGLAPATVSSIVRELNAAGLVETEPGAGRRGTAVRLARAAGLVAGCAFGHSHLSVAVADLTGAVLNERRAQLDADHSHQQGLSLARELLGEVLADAGASPSELRAIGLGLPSPIRDGVVHASAILPGWTGVSAAAAAAETFGCPVHVDNDANLGALAEHRVGVARGHRSSAYLKISSGVGAGLIVGDQLFHGAAGTAGEVGHLTLDEQGPVCRCGSRGCLEAYTSIGAVQEMMAAQLPDAGLDEILATARDGNVAAVRALEDAGLHLGWGIASIVNLINPDIVVVGGDLARAGNLLLEPARVGLRRHALDAVASTPIVVSGLAARASLIGAILLAAEATEVALVS